MSDDMYGDSVYADPEASKGAENMDPIENLTSDDPDEDQQVGYNPPDREPYSLRHAPTPAEERANPNLDERLSQEQPEDQGVWRESQPRAGRLVAPDEGGLNDEEKDEVAEDVGPAGYASSAEEAAMHVIPDDEAKR